MGYICQSLVEDGRLKRSQIEYFLDKLVFYLPDDKKLYIKLHHKSDLGLYMKYQSKNNVIIVSNKDLLPYTEKYIGHYSSFLALPLHITKNVLLWEFHHHEVPFYFKEIAEYITNDLKILEKFLISKGKPQYVYKNDKLAYYFYYNGIGSEKKIIEYITTVQL